MITLRYAARGKEMIPPLAGGKGRAADQWNVLRRFRWIPRGLSLCWARVSKHSSPAAFSLPAASQHAAHCHLSSNDGAWQWTHRRAAVNFIDEWHLKAGFNAFPKSFSAWRGGVNNRFTFALGTKAKLSPSVSVSTELLRRLVTTSQQCSWYV